MPWLLDCYNEQPVVISRAIADHSYHTPVHSLTGIVYIAEGSKCTCTLSIFTGSSHHYCLFDVLHEGNTKKQEERLRRCGFVPQLAGIVNTQVEEQLHRGFVKNTYFLDNMGPTSHIFLMRHLLQIHNQRTNREAMRLTQRKTGMTISFDDLGRMFTTTGMMHKCTKTYHASMYTVHFHTYMYLYCVPYIVPIHACTLLLYIQAR